MSKKEQPVDSQRRDFLRGSVAVAAGVTVSAATAQTIAGVTGAEATTQPEKKDGYRLTQHIADYYKTAAI